jgi:hypothetical protein
LSPHPALRTRHKKTSSTRVEGGFFMGLTFSSLWLI